MIFAAFVYMIESRVKNRESQIWLFWRLYKAGGKSMLNYEEELAKFQPSLEIDQAEEAILNNDLTDLSDLLEQVITGKRTEGRRER